MERKDFPKWKVELAYIAQDGVCARCGKSLEHGFHRHHKDGDPTNNSLDNLELLCPECHYATFEGPKKEAYEKFKRQEEIVLDKLNKLIDEAFAGKFSGATIERLLEALTMSLKVARRVAGLDREIEMPPPTIQIARMLDETRRLQRAYLEGYKDGVKAGKE